MVKKLVIDEREVVAEKPRFHNPKTITDFERRYLLMRTGNGLCPNQPRI